MSSTSVHVLPRSLDPQRGESLTGYLLNLSHRLGLPPAELASRTGLANTSTTPSINTGYAISLPESTAACFAYACSLTVAEATALTLMRWDGLLFDSRTPAKAARTLQGSGWLSTTSTRACPQCLADPHPHSADRITWQAAWQTPWAVACIRHGVLLEDTCTTCSHPFGQSGHRIPSLIPNPNGAPTHPAACRARPSGSTTLCGHRIDQQATTAAAQSVLALQNDLDALLQGATAERTSLGVPVTPAQYLRDLRAVAVLLQLADERRAFTPLPDSYTAALAQHLETRKHRRAARTRSDRSDRTWTEAPTNTHALAALLVQSASILALPGAGDASHVLPPLVRAASENERLAWNRIRSACEPSDGLFRYFAPNRAGTFSTHMLRAADPTADVYTITSDHVPAHLGSDQYQRWFAAFDAGAENNIRRAVPLAVTQLIEGVDLTTAADRLGIPFVSAQAAIIRAGRASKHAAGADKFRTHIATVARHLQTDPVNYGHRRRVLNAAWAIHQTDWEDMKEQMLAARAARKDTPWDERQTSLTMWIWSLVTGGDPALAPMIATTSPSGRRSTGGALAAYTTLTHRAPLMVAQLVRAYADHLAQQVDASQPPRQPALGRLSVSVAVPTVEA